MPNVDGTNSLESISCPSTTKCVAVDDVGNVVIATAAPTSCSTGEVINPEMPKCDLVPSPVSGDAATPGTTTSALPVVITNESSTSETIDSVEIDSMSQVAAEDLSSSYSSATSTPPERTTV
ncbi:MAG: hypothetical protein M1115_11955 [Actinobacteria bacterium]|nr:hypothetical protein [Actinomycetota bacterium]